MKKILCVFILIVSAFGVYAAENLVKDESFGEDFEYWTPYSYTDGAEIYAENGRMVFDAPQDNHLNVTQKIKVEPNTNYRFSAHVKTENVEETGSGAVLGFDYKTSYSESVFGNDEKNIELYFTTKANEVPIMLSLGGYSSLSRGKAIFSDIVVEKAGSVPENAKYYEYINDKKETKTSAGSFDFRWFVLAGLLAAAAAAGIYTVYSEK